MAEDEDQTALRLLAREVAAREVGPRAAHGDETGEVPTEAIKALAAADLFRVTIGEQWGGLGYGDVESSIVLEEVARHDVSTAICCQLAFNGPARGIEHLGNPALQDRWLPAVANGEAIVSIGITEPEFVRAEGLAISDEHKAGAIASARASISAINAQTAKAA